MGSILWLCMKMCMWCLSIIMTCIIGTVLTLQFFTYNDIAHSYEDEVEATRFASFVFDDEQHLSIEGRSETIADYAVAWLAPMPTDGGRSEVANGLTQALNSIGILPWYNNTFRPGFVAFAPLLAMRVELYLTCFIWAMPLMFVGYFLGEALARRWNREGKRRMELSFKVVLVSGRIINGLALMLMGGVFMPPVVTWIIASIVLSAVTVVLARAHGIEVQ
jgi:hypothetical protein